MSLLRRPFGHALRGGRSLRVLVMAALLVLVAAACVKDLGTLGDGDYSSATAINDSGVTVGYSNVAPGTAGAPWHAFRREPGGPLVDLNGSFASSVASAVNEQGRAVGYAEMDGARYAVMWDPDGTAHDLGAGPGSEATDIADDGTIIGSRIWTDGGPDTGFVRDAVTGEFSPLPHAVPDGGPVVYQRPFAINEHGDIVGIECCSPDTVALLWQGPDHQPVVLSGQSALARPNDIADDGTIVGAEFERSWSIAVVWRPGSQEAVRIAPPNSYVSAATAINDQGEIVGWATQGVGSDSWAFSRDPETGEFTDLGGLGGPSAKAVAVNAAGDAAGLAATTEERSPGVPEYHAVVFQAPTETSSQSRPPER
jgi:probable HAF family extracellular repeat protein